VRECPQGAKKIRSDKDKAKELIASGQSVAASVAPSFAAVYSGSLANRLPSLLRGLGFKYVSETAEGANYITARSFEKDQKGTICTACPAVVNYIEKYTPQFADELIPIVSPMIAHGRLLKQRYKNCAVVFIGPCAAKKMEITRPENTDATDCVITFQELDEWLKDEGVDVENTVESGFDHVHNPGDARLFPLEGGMLTAGGIKNSADSENLKITGAENFISFLADKDNVIGRGYVEPLFCKGGCIGGPAFPGGKMLFERRKNIIDYWKSTRDNETNTEPRNQIQDKADFKEHSANLPPVSENTINKIFAQTGKTDPALQLNCEACGYRTCEENAIAIARGLAEPEMCLPYMRRLAQQRTDRIIDTTPNGVVIVDSDLRMIKMNPAFQKMFMCNNGILGRRVSYLVNAEGFEKLQLGAVGASDKVESIQMKYGIRYHEILYALRDEGQYVGIYSDISKLKFDREQLDVVKAQTLLHAREFLDHQIRFAQEMAHYLGKSTAQSEEIAKRLIALYEGSEESE
jgi:iron only hydrogenase large subunit-like protein